MPDDLELVSAVTGALLPLVYEENWEQLGTMTPAQAAAIMSAAFDAFVAGECGDAGCSQPGGMRVYRISPTTRRFDYLENGAWLEDEAIPPTPTREEPTEDERLCAAASNAVYVLKLTWQQAMSDFDANMAAQDAIVDTFSVLAAMIGGVFYPPIIAIAGLTEAGWEIVYEAYAALTMDVWDDTFTNLMVCLFLDNAVDAGGVVTFNVEQILRDLWGQALTGGAYLTMAGQIQWILGTIGSGIDAAGALDIVPGDCNCGEWCYNFEFATGPEDWSTPVIGTFITPAGAWGADGWTGTIAVDNVNARGINVVIQRAVEASCNHIEIWYDRTNGQYQSVIPEVQMFKDIGLPSQSTLHSHNSPGAQGVDQVVVWDGVDTELQTITLRMSASFRTGGANPSPLGTLFLKKVVMSGVGPNPFGQNNCIP